MEKSFANLLRYSRLATYDHTLDQVYKSPKTYRKIGDWGLKRNLPTVIQTKHVIVNALDTAEHQTPWQSGNSKVLFLKRWKENFPNSRKPRPRSDEEPKLNVAQMSPAQFQRFLKTVEKTKAREFQDKLAIKEVVPDQAFDYINVTFNMDETAPTTTSVTDGAVPTSGPVSTGDSVVGPTYSDYTVDVTSPVQGRLFNSTKDKYAVGIGGVVAYVEKRGVLGYNNSNRSVQNFFVRHAEIDESGRPNVQVALGKNDPHRDYATNYLYEELMEDKDYAGNKKRDAASDIYFRKNKTKPIDAKTNDHIKENEKNEVVMARIQNILTPGHF